jgi:hypothetical protein
MVVRRNRASGDDFWGCSRYPDCRGTRPIGAAAPNVRSNRPRRPTKYKLSLGGKPRGIADHGELIVARLIGRNLNKREGCLVQALTILLFLGAIYLLFASGLFLAIVMAFSDWYAHQIRLPGAPTPTS